MTVEELGVDRFCFNGVDATTGRYLLPPLTVEEVSRLARGAPWDAQHLDELRWRHTHSTEAVFGVAEGVDPRDLADAGWGVVAAATAGPEVLEALRPLLDLRREQASRVSAGRYRELVGPDGYRPGESKQDFLARHGAGPGPVDPDRMPYYLLLVGGPEEVPFSVQYQLDVQHAVGRLAFETAEQYACYAESVVAAEALQGGGPPAVEFFAPVNADDRATALSASELVAPLVSRLSADHPGWTIGSTVGEHADKRRLAALLGSQARPSLLFTASHGTGWPADHPLQRRRQGSLVCAEWEGPGSAIDAEACLGADDVGADASVSGLIAFHFACFGAGTPAWDDYGQRQPGTRRRLSARPFVAALPQRLLSHERGAALAVVGHVDRAWGCSFSWPGAGRQVEVFRSSLERLLAGHPVGSAFEYFDERYAELSSDLAAALEDVSYGRRPDHLALAAMWTANNDARGVAVLGDPAVRLTAPAPALTPARQRTTLLDHRDGPEVADGSTPADEPALPPTDVPEPHDTDFGLFDGMRQTRQRLTAAVQQLAETLADALERAAESVAVVEVSTSTSPDLSQAVYDRSTRRYSGARLRAVSRAGIGGDQQLVVDESSPLDDRLWAFHVAMVEQAQRTRTELFKNAGTAVAGLADALRPG